jgi:hypothetical protein
MASKAHLSFLLLSVVVASLVGSSAGVFHIVGAGKGWTIAPNQTYYADWARTRNIRVGDKLSKLQFRPSPIFDLMCASQDARPGDVHVPSDHSWCPIYFLLQLFVSCVAVFLYRSGVYDIVQVPTKELFDACSMNNVTMRYQLGPTIIKLTEPGPRYYFCGVGKHCEGGQKVAVNVAPAVAAPAGLPVPTPPASLAQPAKKL